jgi:hypothetical protein
MPDETPANDVHASAADDLEKLRAELAAMAQGLKLNAWQRGRLIMRLADTANPGNFEQIAEDIRRAGEQCAAASPLLTPYMLALAAKYVRLDDWPAEPAAMAAMTLQAVQSEIASIAAEHSLPPRLLLLLDSLLRVIDHYAGPRPDSAME